MGGLNVGGLVASRPETPVFSSKTRLQSDVNTFPIPALRCLPFPIPALQVVTTRSRQYDTRGVRCWSVKPHEIGFLFLLILIFSAGSNEQKGYDDGGSRGGMGAAEELHRTRGCGGESKKGGAQQETAGKPTPLRPRSEVKTFAHVVQMTA